MRIEISPPMEATDAERVAVTLNGCRGEDQAFLVSWHGACFFPQIVDACHVRSQRGAAGVDALSVVIEISGRQLGRQFAKTVRHLFWCRCLPPGLKRFCRRFRRSA